MIVLALFVALAAAPQLPHQEVKVDDQTTLRCSEPSFAPALYASISPRCASYHPSGAARPLASPTFRSVVASISSSEATEVTISNVAFAVPQPASQPLPWPLSGRTA